MFFFSGGVIFENGMGSCNFPIKDRTLVRACVCVWTICTDVKLPCLVDGCFSWFFYFALQSQGARNPSLSVRANEDQTVWG